MLYDAQGNLHQKKFDIVPAGPDLGSILPMLRARVCRDHFLDFGARLMLTHLIDLSVQVVTYRSLGVVVISQTKLSETLGASVRTVFSWKRQLEERGYVWLSEQPMPNAWPIDCYHIAELDPREKRQFKTSVEGNWGNGERRARPANPGSGARSVAGSPLPAEDFAGLNAQVLDSAAPSGNPLPVSAAVGCGSQPQPVAAGSRSRLRAAPETGCHGEPQPVAGGTGNGLRAAPEAGCRHNTAKVGGSEGSSGGKRPPRDADGFEERLKKLFPRELDALKAELIADQRRLEPGDPMIADISCRIQAVDRARKGGITPKRKAAVQPAKPIAPVARRSASQEEILDGARYLVSIGKGAEMNAAQKAAWESAQEADGKSAPKS